jgi:hypothetical protein
MTVKRRTNDVLWRSLADLNRIILHADREGTLRPEPQRRLLHVVDAIIGIDREGPIDDSRVHSRTVVAGADPVRVDAVCARIMGYDPSRIMLVERTSHLTGEQSVGTMRDYKRSLVCTRAPGRFPRVYPYEPPGMWKATGDFDVHYRRGV